MPTDNHTLFQDPEVKYPANSLDLSFSDYIAQCKALIEKTRTDLKDNPKAELIIAANTPFELIPDQPASPRCGALLIHGLYDCPFVMREIGVKLQAQGLLVRSILLPGHGTVPAALLRTTYQEWLATADYGVASLAKEVDKIFLVGFSTGATIALNQILKNKFSNIAGLILLAAAIKISPFAAIMNLPPKLSWLSKRTAWFHVAEETDYTKYCSFTCNSAYQLYLLIQENNRLSEINKSLELPALVVLTQDDQTISSNAAIKFLKKYLPDSRLLLYTNDSKQTDDTQLITRPAAYPQWNITNISHVALTNSPQNPHYGIQGDYIDASHVEENLKNGGVIFYGTFTNFQNDIFNLLHKMGLYRHKYVRLTFNPDFEFLEKTINKFVSDF